jgi:hypothetical protein
MGLGSRRSLGRISTPGDMGVIARRGDWQDFADRLEPMRRAVIERRYHDDDGFCRVAAGRGYAERCSRP